ncbi:MAG: response regulator [Acidobacteria bacterium]|nr:response regulator [Acidobacteriota bacterium]
MPLSANPSRLPGQPTPRVLVVDDDRVTLRILQEMLSRLGCEVRLAGNALEGLDLLRQERVDIVFLDVVLPGMNGIKACEAIKAHGPWRNIGVILLTGERQDLKSQAFGAGADDFLTKPIDPLELQARLRIHLLTRRIEQADQWRLMPAPTWEEPRPGRTLALVNPSTLAVDLQQDMNTLGMDYREVHALPEFLLALEQGPADLLIIDASSVPGPLPRFVQALRQIPGAVQVPLLVVCEESRLEEELPLLREDRVDLVANPLVLPELQLRVRSLLNLARKEDIGLELGPPFLDPDSGALTRPFLEAFLAHWAAGAGRIHTPWCLVAVQFPVGSEPDLVGRREALQPIREAMEPGDLLAKMGDRTFVVLLLGRTAAQGELLLWMLRRKHFKGKAITLEGRDAPAQVLLGELATGLLNSKPGAASPR